MNNDSHSRTCPSPRYRELLGQYEKMHREGDVEGQLDADRTFDGLYSLRHARAIKRLIDRYRARSILDYGCGKGSQYRMNTWTLPDGETLPPLPIYWECDAIACYDPAVSRFSELPQGTYDGVICTDVLEHCPGEDMPWIVDELLGFARQFVYANVACYAADKRLPNGENAHCTIQDESWWRALIERACRKHPEVAFQLTLEGLPDEQEPTARSDSKRQIA